MYIHICTQWIVLSAYIINYFINLFALIHFHSIMHIFTLSFIPFNSINHALNRGWLLVTFLCSRKKCLPGSVIPISSNVSFMTSVQFILTTTVRI